MEVDTGAAVSLVSERIWKELGNGTLEKSSAVLTTYSKEKLKIIGETLVKVTYKGQEAELALLVVKEDGPALMGRNWLQAIRLDWSTMRIHRVKQTSGAEELKKKYSELFRDEIGTLKGFRAKLRLKDDASPRFYRPRSVPYAFRQKIGEDLERMEKVGILEKIPTSRWASPIVPIPKADGSLRICGDYKITVNRELEVDQYPLPKPDDLFATLAGGTVFSKLDLASAYQQVLLDEESKDLTAINTHKGLFQYTRLPFGIASAPAVFQNLMEQMLHGLNGVVCYLDDILVTGSTLDEHGKNLEAVLKRLQDSGLRLRESKCQLLQTEVE
eukprot:m.210272 g.210272  ORF g.210272 m.210272 type:complete len:329 (+) comp39743_c0_seq9:1996-2982(+)